MNKSNFKRENLWLKYDFNLQIKCGNNSSEAKVLRKTILKRNIVLGMQVYFCNLSLAHPRQEDHESEARLEYVANWRLLWAV